MKIGGLVNIVGNLDCFHVRPPTSPNIPFLSIPPISLFLCSVADMVHSELCQGSGIGMESVGLQSY